MKCNHRCYLLKKEIFMMIVYFLNYDKKSYLLAKAYTRLFPLSTLSFYRNFKHSRDRAFRDSKRDRGYIRDVRLMSKFRLYKI